MWNSPQVTVTQCAGDCAPPAVVATTCAGECGPTPVTETRCAGECGPPPAVTETRCAGECGPPVGATETVFAGEQPHTPSLTTYVVVYTSWFPIGGSGGYAQQSSPSYVTSYTVETILVGGGNGGFATSTLTNIGCPAGFIMCGANYAGGCCRADRGCDTTTCPPPATSVVTMTTAVAGAGGLAPPKSCPSGWYGCPADVGGGCCPNSYVCGSYCTATIAGQPNVAREYSSASFVRSSLIVGSLGVAVSGLLAWS